MRAVRPGRGNRDLTAGAYGVPMFAKYQGVFRSRWKALWWAAGVLLTAYCSIPSADETGNEDAPAPAAHHHHVNPWARADKDKR